MEVLCCNETLGCHILPHFDLQPPGCLVQLPGADNVSIAVADDGSATVTGNVSSQEDREKILVAVGNVAGVGQVTDSVTVVQAGAESRYYTVKSGDTLSAIARSVYGSASDYQRIFDANKPMLTHPDKIYPGQVLIIPETRS